MTMDKTKELIKKQHDALVDVIHYLDSTKQSNTKIRETVDRALNGSDWKDLDVQSSLEVHNAEVIHKRYIKQLKKIEAIRNVIEERQNEDK
jgi:acyl CoA:acetate/3-ketoacid CoA transferase